MKSKGLLAVVPIFFVLLVCCTTTVLASDDVIEAVGNAVEYPSYVYEPEDQDKELILSGYSAEYDEESGILDESIIRLRAEDNYELCGFIDTPDKISTEAKNILRFAEWNNMSILASWNLTEVESKLEEEAKTHTNDIVFSSIESDINAEIYGTFDAPIYFDQAGGYLAGLESDNDIVRVIIWDGENLTSREDCIESGKRIDDFASQNGYQKRDDLWGTIFYNANQVRLIQPEAIEMNEELLDAKEIALGYDRIEN